MFRLAHLLFGARHPYGPIFGRGMYRFQRAERRAYRRAMRRRNPLAVWGILWILFWVVFGTVVPLAVKRGGSDFQHIVTTFVRSTTQIAVAVADFAVAVFRELFRGVA